MVFKTAITCQIPNKTVDYFSRYVETFGIELMNTCAVCKSCQKNTKAALEKFIPL